LDLKLATPAHCSLCPLWVIGGPKHDADVSVLLVEQSVMQSLEVANRAYILADGLFVMSVIAADIGAHPELKRAYLGL
jgi:branched-chain amino acid transport system ATP-binding protein